MANEEAVMTMVRAYRENNRKQFKEGIQSAIAAAEKKGRRNEAEALKKELEAFDALSGNEEALLLMLPVKKTATLDTFITTEEIRSQIQKIISEYKNRYKLFDHNYKNRRKILLEGETGSGKTLTASIIAGELGLPLFSIQLDRLVGEHKGERARILRQVFDRIDKVPAVYFFDEFDALLSPLDEKVDGEIRMFLNSFLQYIENDSSQSIILAATNNCRIPKPLLFSRFDAVIHYAKPAEAEVRALLERKIRYYEYEFKVTDRMVKAALGLSQRDITNACSDAVKDALIASKPLSEEKIIKALEERAAIYKED